MTTFFLNRPLSTIKFSFAYIGHNERRVRVDVRKRKNEEKAGWGLVGIFFAVADHPVERGAIPADVISPLFTLKPFVFEDLFFGMLPLSKELSIFYPGLSFERFLVCYPLTIHKANLSLIDSAKFTIPKFLSMLKKIRCFFPY